jgi:cysteine desulfurase
MKKQVYFDNAATTPIDPKVAELIVELLPQFGNPSSTHSFGRAAKAILEKARKTVAEYMGVSTAEVVFTSGGTEADNFAIKGAVAGLGVRRVVSSELEHHAVLHCIDSLPESVERNWLKPDSKGNLSLEDLEELLRSSYEPTLVSLMHANNEIGNFNEIDAVGQLCKKYGAWLHCDSVQTVGHYSSIAAHTHFLAASAHKFHGPKGVGFALVRKDAKIPSLLNGGSQERGFRGGTENVVMIAAMAKALEISLQSVDEHRLHIEALKKQMIEGLRKIFGSNMYFNGLSDTEKSLYTVLNVSLPALNSPELFLFNLDMQGVAASAGSACSSGAAQGSHVLRAIGADTTRINVRFSFSRFNTAQEIDFALEKLSGIFALKGKPSNSVK